MMLHVKVAAEEQQLMADWVVVLEPPYWVLRCRGCGQLNYLPWDARLRTRQAHDGLLQHGRQCAAEQHNATI
jgi:hypothetical protein